jgi:hypothetical protein
LGGAGGEGVGGIGFFLAFDTQQTNVFSPVRSNNAFCWMNGKHFYFPATVSFVEQICGAGCCELGAVSFVSCEDGTDERYSDAQQIHMYFRPFAGRRNELRGKESFPRSRALIADAWTIT